MPMASSFPVRMAMRTSVLFFPANQEAATMGQSVVHFEIDGLDGAALREFYSTLFEWRIDVLPNNPAEYG